jgi:deoxyribonuclease V
MILAVDVDYRENGAIAAGVAFGRWEDAAPAWEIVERIAEVAEYEPGAFYKRELPCLLALLQRAPEPVRALVIDGYVWLGDGKPGLGAHLHHATGLPVIGVAKTCFRSASAREVVRGTEARRPLYVTAVGIQSTEAAEQIRTMHGEHRLPTLLKRVDSLCRRQL